MQTDLEYITAQLISESYNEENDLIVANNKLKNIKTSEELIKLVDDYGNNKLGVGYPIYLIGKRSGWRLFDGTKLDNTKAQFLVSDGISHKVIDINNVYKYYIFSDKCRA